MWQARAPEQKLKVLERKQKIQSAFGEIMEIIVDKYRDADPTMIMCLETCFQIRN